MTKNEVQKNAVNAWCKKGKHGTLELSTGVGKTIASLHCLRTMPEKDGKVHLFLAETEARQIDLEADIEKYKELFDYDIRKNYNLVFKCYQGVYRLKDYSFGLVIADEIHNGLTPQYSQFFDNNQYDAVVGLTATVERGTKYLVDGVEITKGVLLDKYAPVCFRYTQKDALEDDIGRMLDVYIVEMELDSKNKTEQSGSKTKPFYQTELAKYQYLHKNFVKSFYCHDPTKKDIMIRNSYKWRADYLYKMPRRIEQAKLIADNIPGKTVVFGNDLESVIKVTKNTVSSKNSEEENNNIRELFDKNRIQTIGSYKMLKQGANLGELDNCIQMSYHSTETNMIQITGRLRKNGEKPGRVIMFVMKGTFEEEVLIKLLGYIKYNKLFRFKNASDLLTHIYKEELFQ